MSRFNIFPQTVLVLLLLSISATAVKSSEHEVLRVLASVKRQIEYHRCDPEKYPLNDETTSLIGTLQPPDKIGNFVLKDAISSSDWREFTAETIVMATFAKTVMTDDETLKIDLYVDHRGDYPIGKDAKDGGATIYLNISDGEGSIIKHDRVPLTKRIEPGWHGKVASYTLKLSEADYLEAPTRLDVEILLRWSGHRNPDCPNSNRYKVWVYPKKPAFEETLSQFQESGAVFAQTWDENTIKQLQEDKTVLVFAPIVSKTRLEIARKIYSRTAMSNSVSSNSNYDVMFHRLEFRPDHRAFADFPAPPFYNDFWYHLRNNSSTLFLPDTPKDWHPIAGMPDPRSNSETKVIQDGCTAFIFESKIGKGKLLLCSTSLDDTFPTRENIFKKQLCVSLMKYMLSNDFDPDFEISESVYEDWQTLQSSDWHLFLIQPSSRYFP